MPSRSASVRAPPRGGQARKALTESQAPEGAEDTVKIHAHTHHGNVDIPRAER
ncbi:hypothetical protein ACQZM9_34000 [Streptomyces sp. P11-1]|uniref:hypothetical protein n=1 Tax=Streptomyces sp. P11-1 TaxID=3423221 RepID=UPI003D2F0CAE